jgi:hypothetical protein
MCVITFIGAGFILFVWSLLIHVALNGENTPMSPWSLLIVVTVAAGAAVFAERGFKRVEEKGSQE